MQYFTITATLSISVWLALVCRQKAMTCAFVPGTDYSTVWYGIAPGTGYSYSTVWYGIAPGTGYSTVYPRLVLLLHGQLTI